jgi:P4 family phage/plasmid primase-like protien
MASETESESLVIAAKVKCQECNYKNIIQFNPPLPYVKYYNWSWTKKCPDCQSDCLTYPIHEGDNGSTKSLEQELTKKYHFKSIKDTRELYFYDDIKGVYRKGGEWIVEQEALKYDPEITTRDATDIKNRIIWANYTDRSEFNFELEWLSCKNVMVNLLTGEVKPHSPDFMATVQIPHDYLISKAPFVPYPPKIWRFLHEVMAYDDVETVLDFMAYCLWRDFPFHRWLLFNGSGRNGKGVTTQLITRFLGRQNVSNETLHRILENKFATANLYGRLANIDADMSKEELKHTRMLKMLTGGDEIQGEFKFKPAFHFKNYAKLIFSANELPITPDETDAFFARLIIIEFPNQFLGDKANPDLIDELTTDQEMSALFTMLVRRLPRVLKSGISTHHSSIGENYEKYIASSNPIRIFVEKYIETGVINNDETKEDVHNTYEKFCMENRLSKESSETFSRRLKKDYNFTYKQERTGKTKQYYWKNIRLRGRKEVEEGQETLD